MRAVRAQQIRRIVAACSAPVVVVSMVACGVPSSDGAEPLPSEFNVVGPSVAPSTPLEGADAVVEVAWVNSRGRLELVPRPVVADTREEKLDVAIDALIGGPDDSELAEGLTSTISTNAQLEADLRGRRAVVDIIEGGSPAPDPPLSVAQVATTVLAVPNVTSVVFVSDGERTSVPIPKGSNTARALTMKDFRSLIN